MRYQGKIKTWKDDKGFGFISPNGGGADIFLHISKLTGTKRKPVVGDSVTFEVVSDSRNRKQGVNVLFAGQKIKPVTANRLQLASLIVPLLNIKRRCLHWLYPVFPSRQYDSSQCVQSCY